MQYRAPIPVIVLLLCIVACNSLGAAARQEDWSQLSGAEFADVAVKIACSKEARNAKGAPAELVDFTWRRYLMEPKRLAELDAPTLFEMLAVVAPKLSEQQRTQFAAAYHRAIFDTARPQPPAPEELVLLGWAMVKAGDWVPDEGSDQYLAALLPRLKEREVFAQDVALLQKGMQTTTLAQEVALQTYLNPFWYQTFRGTIDDSACSFYHALFSDKLVIRDYAAGYFYGRALRSAGARHALATSLLDDAGRPRLGVAKVLAFAHRAAGDIDQWISHLDGKLTDTSISGDHRALWCLVRAHAQEVRGHTADVQAGRKWLEDAIATASSDDTRSLCIASLALRHSVLKEHPKALSVAQATPKSSDALTARRESLLATLEAERAMDERAETLKRDVAEFQKLEDLAERLRDKISALQKSRDPNAADLVKAKASLLNVEQRLDVLMGGDTVKSR